MKKKIALFILIFLFGITSVKAATVATVDGHDCGGKDCESLAEAITEAINSGAQSTITLLQNQSENIIIPSGANIILDLNGFTLSNKGTDNKATVITNEGTLEIKNGTITSNSQSGMINNNEGGVLTINSGTYRATGNKQVLYNNKGNATIGGNAYLESNINNRATVHNLNGGTVNIVGGTIVSKNGYAVYNDKGTLNIGTKDDEYVQTTPVIQGKTYGVIANEKYNVYDGIIKGGTYHVGTANSATAPTTAKDTNETKINDYENESEKRYGNESIDGSAYKTFYYYLDNSSRVTISFDLNGGIGINSSKKITIGNPIGDFPEEPLRSHYTFAGWYDDPTNGNPMSPSSTPSVDTTIYAHWDYDDAMTVVYSEKLGGYTSIEIAAAIGGNIRLEKDVLLSSDLEMHLPANLDLNGHTIRFINSAMRIGSDVTIDDKSTNKNGLITSNSDFTVYVGEENVQIDASLIHKGGTIEGLGAYGAIRNYATTIIDGGTVTANATESEYVIYNQDELIVKSGTVHSTNGRAIQVHENSTFVMDGGLVTSDAENDQTVNLYGNCSATINGGTIEGLNNNTAGIAMFGNTNLTVNGGTIKGHAMAIAGNGNEISGNANITINDGTLIATNGVGMYLPQRNSTTIINGGNISGPTAIEIRAADLIVNGGTITATSDTYSVTTNGNGTTTTGAAIAVSQHNTKLPIHVVINDGTFSGKVPVCDVNPMNNPQDALDLIDIDIRGGNFNSTGNTMVDSFPSDPFITGGTYTFDPSAYVVDGYTVLQVGNKYEVFRVFNVIIDSSCDNLISINNNSYLPGEEVEFTINGTIDPEATLEVRDSNGNLIEVTNNKFTMPTSDVIIKIVYKPVLSPQTGDNLLSYILLLEVAIIGLLSVKILNKKDIK